MKLYKTKKIKNRPICSRKEHRGLFFMPLSEVRKNINKETKYHRNDIIHDFSSAKLASVKAYDRKLASWKILHIYKVNKICKDIIKIIGRKGDNE